MDTVARLGGDEFVVLVPGLDGPAQALAVGERIVATLGDPVRVKGATVSVKASIGITMSDPVLVDLPTADRLLLQAGTATYHAKSLGGGRTEIFDADSPPSTLEADRVTWIARIRSALDEERLVLYAQPIVDLATGDVVVEELLLRMLDRDGKVIPPLAFLPTAERCGLISEIDRWVISRGIALAAGGRRLAINLSAASAGDPDVLELIKREIDANGTDPADLVFEITETAIMENTERARRFAAQLVALGCRFALDDFGTGFASFTYLKHLPVQYLKIDLDFVRNLSHSPRDVAVVKAIVALANDFGQETIAEGVEDQEAADLLRELGVTFAQGYLFSRPAPVDDA
jgi:EAL domain-containing protein (putative c-di-GMP-specific phosphodiesterase class I)